MFYNIVLINKGFRMNNYLFTHKNKINNFSNLYLNKSEKDKILQLIKKNEKYLEETTKKILLRKIDNCFEDFSNYVYELLVIDFIKSYLKLIPIKKFSTSISENFDAKYTVNKKHYNFEISTANKNTKTRKLKQLKRRTKYLKNNGVQIYISPEYKIIQYDYAFNLNFDYNFNVIQDK